MNREPVMSRAGLAGVLIVLVKAAVAFGSTMGWIAWDDAQSAAFNAFVIALVDAAIVLTLSWQARNQVTPVDDPHDREGRRLTPEGE